MSAPVLATFLFDLQEGEKKAGLGNKSAVIRDARDGISVPRPVLNFLTVGSKI
jgi:hypothetical protein